MSKLTEEQIEKAAKAILACFVATPFDTLSDFTKKSYTEGARAAAPYLQYPAPEYAGDLVEAMCEAYGAPSRLGDIYKRMSAALHVAAERMLGPVTDEEWHNDNIYLTIGTGGALDRPSVNDLLAKRRAKLLAPELTEAEEIEKILRSALLSEGDSVAFAREILAMQARRREAGK